MIPCRKLKENGDVLYQNNHFAYVICNGHKYKAKLKIHRTGETSYNKLVRMNSLNFLSDLYYLVDNDKFMEILKHCKTALRMINRVNCKKDISVWSKDIIKYIKSKK